MCSWEPKGQEKERTVAGWIKTVATSDVLKKRDRDRAVRGLTRIIENKKYREKVIFGGVRIDRKNTFSSIFGWDDSKEGFTFWSRVEDAVATA